MNAFKCDHCKEYFDGRGTHKFNGEACDKKEGFVRYRSVMFVYSSAGPLGRGQGFNPPPPDYETGGKELCAGCLRMILITVLKGEKV